MSFKLKFGYLFEVEESVLPSGLLCYSVHSADSTRVNAMPKGQPTLGKHVVIVFPSEAWRMPPGFCDLVWSLPRVPRYNSAAADAADRYQSHMQHPELL